MPTYSGEERNMHRPSRVLALSSILGSLAFGSTALAQDGSEASLTGIWEGIYVCDDSQAGVQVNFVAEDRVEITEKDDILRLRRVTEDGATSLLYEGPVAALASSERFEAMVSVCGGSYTAKEMVRLRRVQVNEDGSGSFDAESLYESADAPGFEGDQIFGTCKWAYERVSTSNPRVPRC
jgi:hypothetical protein